MQLETLIKIIWYTFNMKQMTYPLTIKIVKERQATDAPYVAYVPEFDISSCGKTEKKAVSNVKEAVQILVSEAKADGVLDELRTRQNISRGIF